MKYKLYLFDFDYTLANSEKGILKCFRHVLDGLGLTDIPEIAIKRTIGMTLEDAFIKLTGEHNLEKIRQYRAEFVTKADDVMTKNTEFYPDTLEVLTYIKDHQSMAGIISTKLAYRIKDQFNKEQALPLLDIIVGGDQVTTPKPAPDGLLYALKKLSVDKKDVLYIGDSVIDAKTAQHAGVDFAAVLTGATTKEEFSEYSCVTIMNSLSELLDLSGRC
ncbi:MAG: HAD-IA family hydrolase [Clostridia bacterium]|nr:HAD-IA family hydrolase [Clostridia bacterium]